MWMAKVQRGLFMKKSRESWALETRQIYSSDSQSICFLALNYGDISEIPTEQALSLSGERESQGNA